MDASAHEYQESTAITFDWTIRSLKQLFDSSKGETKSKVTKSMKFGGGRWQILFYANSGTEGGAYVSLYLSCEPTQEEKENAINGRWVREGVYKFNFELRNINKTVLFNSKEANDHSFSWKTANWGWAQFARRDNVYYQPNTVRHQDAFLITCTITSSPATPAVPPPIPRQSVPKGLLDSVGALLDDPAYSDVEFILPRHVGGGRIKGSRSLYAARRLLKRAEYFESMFDSGFAEAAASQLTLSVGNSQPPDDASSVAMEGQSEHELSLAKVFDDSDAEDEELEEADVDVEQPEDVHHQPSMNQDNGSPHLPDEALVVVPKMAVSESMNSEPTDGSTVYENPSASESMEHIDGSTEFGAESRIEDDASIIDALRSVRPKLSHPSSPRHVELQLAKESEASTSALKLPAPRNTSPGPKKIKIVVKDVAYATYRAVLYYLYTDTILFAPLSSSFIPVSVATPTYTPGNTLGVPEGPTTPMGGGPSGSNRQINLGDYGFVAGGPTTRKEWLKEWQTNHPGRILPCSAKAVYRVADKLDLTELKARAFHHIIKSLTVQNVPYEVFSNFSAIFEEVRKVQVNFFLDHWNEIRGSDAMKNVWQQIRLGRHPGFEEVWPLIAVNLEYKIRSSGSDDGNGEKGADGSREK